MKYWNNDNIQNIYVLDRRNGDLYDYHYILGHGTSIHHYNVTGDAVDVNPNVEK